MRDPTINGEAQVEAKGRTPGGDQLDKAGQPILRLLQKAAGVAEENSRHAIETAQKLSQQLLAAEDRIARLKAEVGAQCDAPRCGSRRALSCESSRRPPVADRPIAAGRDRMGEEIDRRQDGAAAHALPT
jgi:hypothetical protein